MHYDSNCIELKVLYPCGHCGSIPLSAMHQHGLEWLQIQRCVAIVFGLVQLTIGLFWCSDAPPPPPPPPPPPMSTPCSATLIASTLRYRTHFIPVGPCRSVQCITERQTCLSITNSVPQFKVSTPRITTLIVLNLRYCIPVVTVGPYRLVQCTNMAWNGFSYSDALPQYLA